MQINHVVTCFLEYQGSILILKRSRQVGSYEERWAGVSGYIEEDNSPFEQALLELSEEAALMSDDVEMLREGRCVQVVDEKLDCTWIVHPFLFRLHDPAKIVLDWEHTECRWINPEDIKILTTVPSLYEAWLAVL